MYLINIDGLSIAIGIIATCFFLSKSNPVFKVMVIAGAMSLATILVMIGVIN